MNKDHIIIFHPIDPNIIAELKRDGDLMRLNIMQSMGIRMQHVSEFYIDRFNI